MAGDWESQGIGEGLWIAPQFPGKDIIELLDKREGHWSGKGQVDVSFTRKDTIPLTGSERKEEGTYGTVSRSMLRIDDREIIVAIKEMKLYTANKQKVTNEINILRNLQHRHLITFIGSFSVQTTTTIIMYPCATCDLEKLLGILDKAQHAGKRDEATRLLSELGWIATTKGGRPEESWEPANVHPHLRRICGCVSSGLLYLQQKKIRHKDIKPSNILVDHKAVYITDFNVSANYDDKKSSRTSGPYTGTWQYSAPECYFHRERGSFADVYSLGLVFVDIFTYITSQPMTRMKEYVRMEDPATPADVRRNAGLKIMWVTRIFHDSGRENHAMRDLIHRMISEDEQDRPHAFEVISELWEISPNGQFFCNSCREHKNCFGYKGLLERYRLLQEKYGKLREERDGLDKELDIISDKLARAKTETQSTTSVLVPSRSPTPRRSALSLNESSSQTSTRTTRTKLSIIRNKKGDRLDLDSLRFAQTVHSLDEASLGRLRELRDMKLCRDQYLRGGCRNNLDCFFVHDEKLSSEDLDMLQYLVRASSPCNKGKVCTAPKCIYGHLCPQGPSKDAHGCPFTQEMHVTDTVPFFDNDLNE